MVISILAIVIGVLILGAAVYYLAAEKEDAESKKIYGIISAVGAVIAIFGVVKLIFFK